MLCSLRQGEGKKKKHFSAHIRKIYPPSVPPQKPLLETYPLFQSRNLVKKKVGAVTRLPPPAPIMPLSLTMEILILSATLTRLGKISTSSVSMSVSLCVSLYVCLFLCLPLYLSFSMCLLLFSSLCLPLYLYFSLGLLLFSSLCLPLYLYFSLCLLLFSSLCLFFLFVLLSFTISVSLSVSLVWGCL